MTRHTLTAVAAGLLVLLPSCLRQDGGYETVPSLTVTDTSIVVPCTYGKDTIEVTSNRGWSVITDASCTWLRVSPGESLNLGSSTLTSPLVLTRNRNMTYQSRETSFAVSGEGVLQRIKVLQEAADSSTEISGVEDFDVLDTLNFRNTSIQ